MTPLVYKIEVRETKGGKTYASGSSDFGTTKGHAAVR
jgi:hypothetical protein